MHGSSMSKKRPNEIVVGGAAGVVRHFKRPSDPPLVSKSIPSTPANDKGRQSSSAGGSGGAGAGANAPAAGNPSKRHRERLNTELDAVAALLPFESGIIARLDKLSVLRLAVSYLEAKTFFQVLHQRWPFGGTYASAFLNPRHFAQEQTILKALGGFLLILNENGDIIYATENIETLLGFHQSDTLHQPIFDMVHSEDRDELRRMLCWNYAPPVCPAGLDYFLPSPEDQSERQASVRFRCFLDNTCGFMRVDIRGRLVILESCLPHCYVASRPEPTFPIFGLIAVCIPLVMPSHVDASPDEPFLRSKHTLNFSFSTADPKLIQSMEIDDSGQQLSTYTLYTFADPRDSSLVSEAHKQVIQNGAAGLLVYRLISRKSHRTYWIQSSCRLMMKNGKPDSIACSHRLLTEYEGTVLLSKRSSLAAKVLVLEDNMSTNASMSLLYGNAAAAQSSPNTSGHPTSTDYRSRQQQQPPSAPPGMIAAGQQPLYATNSKPAGVRFRSSGKRSRVTTAKAQQQQISSAISSTSVQESTMSGAALLPLAQPILALAPTSPPLPSYLIYPPPPPHSNTAASGGGFLPYYLQQQPPSPDGSSPQYAQQMRQYNGQSSAALQHAQHQQQLQLQQQQATELQLHYHLHQHYASPTPYYPDGPVPKQSLSPPISTTMAMQTIDVPQLQHQPGFPAVEQIVGGHHHHAMDPGHGHHHGNPFWMYSSSQAQPLPPIDHRSKPSFSIQEVTNTLLSQ